MILSAIQKRKRYALIVVSSFIDKYLPFKIKKQTVHDIGID